MFIVTLFTTPRKQSQLEVCKQMDGLKKKIQYTYTAEFYVVTKENKIMTSAEK